MLPAMRGRGHFSGRDWMLYGIVIVVAIAAAVAAAWLLQ